MIKYSIPLPSAKPGKEYVINRIEKHGSNTDSLKGYGIFPGIKIKLLFSSPTKNPSAYEIMGTVLALRHEDSNDIYISPVNG
ncbi:MAG: ferrous iron transport protein A [Clostridiales bacterium]|nr:ferrous iron transport protein A [Clostridiales bacterium]